MRSSVPYHPLFALGCSVNLVCGTPARRTRHTPQIRTAARGCFFVYLQFWSGVGISSLSPEALISIISILNIENLSREQLAGQQRKVVQGQSEARAYVLRPAHR